MTRDVGPVDRILMIDDDGTVRELTDMVKDATVHLLVPLNRLRRGLDEAPGMSMDELIGEIDEVLEDSG